MGMLRHLFKSRDVDRRVKFWIYLTGPINTLLWGSESWNLSQSNLHDLNVFHHAAIRYILNIKWTQVREQRITNDELRQRFNDIPDIELLIIKRTWTYIGKIVRSPNTSIPKRLMGAWIQCPRKMGHPQNSTKNTSSRPSEPYSPKLGRTDDSKNGLASRAIKRSGSKPSTLTSHAYTRPTT